MPQHPFNITFVVLLKELIATFYSLAATKEALIYGNILLIHNNRSSCPNDGRERFFIVRKTRTEEAMMNMAFAWLKFLILLIAIAYGVAIIMPHMNKRRALKKKFEDHFYDHPYQKAFFKNTWAFLVCAFSAFLFAFGFRAFLAPSNLEELDTVRLISGGMSGISQTLISFIELCFGHPIQANGLYDIIYSIFYFGLNIPVFIVAWRGVGKRFAIFTIINVGLASLFTSLLRYSDESLFHVISRFINYNGGLVSRALLGGVFTGLSSALAYRVDASGGGVDVIAYYIGLKKSKLVGRYSVAINIITITIYTLLNITDVGWGTEIAGRVFVATLFSVLYLFVTMVVIDSINIRNKKVKIEAVSEMPELGKILIGNLPHGATMHRGEGAFTGHEKYVFSMIVSSYEVKHTVQVIREADPNAFIDVFELKHVYGRFFLPPIR